MTPERKRQLILGLAIALLVALTLQAGRESQRSAPPSPVPAITNPGPQGLEAAFLYLSAHGGAVAQEDPLTAIPADARVLVTALPYARSVTDGERAALLRWVDEGGTLVVLAQHEQGLGGALRGVLNPAFVALHLKNRQIGLSEIGKDVKSLLDSAARPEGMESIPARPAIPDALLAGVHELAVSGQRGLDSEPGAAVPLAVAGDTAVMLGQSHGRGRVLVLAGPDVLTNARLDLADNLQFAANLGALGPVYFDEGHHREAPSAEAAALVRYFGPAFLAAILGSALLATALARRLGPLQPPFDGSSRTTRDYAMQLGRLYARARAEPALAADLLHDLRARARDRAHLPPSADDAEVALRLAQDGAPRAERYRQLCAALQQASGGLSPAAYAALARDAATLRRELG